jgi:hypothetical protein
MTRLLFTTLLCALGANQVSAQNLVSQRLLELDDDERNASFTLILKDSDRRCDQVIRTLFNGTILGVDEWEALCEDRNAYSLSVLEEPGEATITSRNDVTGIPRVLGFINHFCQLLTVSCAPSRGQCARSLDNLGDNMTSLSLSQPAQGLGITRAIKSRWHSASRKEDGSYEIDTVDAVPSARRSGFLAPWRTAADVMADAELRHRVALAEEKVTELKTALDDMRAQRDAWQAMAQARIRPAPSGTSRWPWLRSTG